MSETETPPAADPITPEQVDTTLAAYALALLHGAEPQDFERDNLIALAARAGAKVTDEHKVHATLRDARAAAITEKLAERARLRDTVTACRDQFRRYQQLHQLKPDGQGQEKAKVNGEFADLCDRALRGVP